MNSIVKKMKLYRISTVLSILPKYWKSSKEIAQHVGATSRISLYVDLLTCLVKYGASDENYLQFRFYGQSDKYRDSFITWRRNMKIMKYMFFYSPCKSVQLPRRRQLQRKSLTVSFVSLLFLL